jgi:hypothetical protein
MNYYLVCGSIYLSRKLRELGLFDNLSYIFFNIIIIILLYKMSIFNGGLKIDTFTATKSLLSEGTTTLGTTNMSSLILTGTGTSDSAENIITSSNGKTITIVGDVDISGNFKVNGTSVSSGAQPQSMNEGTTTTNSGLINANIITFIGDDISSNLIQSSKSDVGFTMVGPVDVSGNFTVDGITKINGGATVDGYLTSTNDLVVKGETYLDDWTYLRGGAVVNRELTVSDGSANVLHVDPVNKLFTINGDLTVNGLINVNGTGTTTSTNSNGTTTTTGSFDTISVGKSGSLTSGYVMDVSGASQINGTLSLSSPVIMSYTSLPTFTSNQVGYSVKTTTLLTSYYPTDTTNYTPVNLFSISSLSPGVYFCEVSVMLPGTSGTTNGVANTNNTSGFNINFSIGDTSVTLNSETTSSQYYISSLYLRTSGIIQVNNNTTTLYVVAKSVTKTYTFTINSGTFKCTRIA